ncbi:MAG: hypothetical protein N2109_12710 [Fimbriimonadales bacterium]|nr:hypothetical protein [Fimbriimonadales bacterium]
MPFRSKRQMRWMFANEPEMARRWARETPDEKSLPERAKPGGGAGSGMAEGKGTKGSKGHGGKGTKGSKGQGGKGGSKGGRC